MSTRATYEFRGPHGLRVTFYIHHDGYEAGAAHYLANALAYKRDADGAPNATLADDFMRANKRAELTGSHESHGDIEFRYTMSNELGLGDFCKVHAEARGYGETWRTVWSGPIDEFCNVHVSECEEFARERFFRVSLGHYGRKYCVRTRTQLVEARDNAQAKLDSYRAKFPTASGNIWSMEADVVRCEEALASIEPQAVQS